MAVSLLPYATLIDNLETILQAVADEEAAIDSGRNFKVYKNRSQNWVESQQSTVFVNIRLSDVTKLGGGNRYHAEFTHSVVFDMYALGTEEEQTDGSLEPADEIAQARLDLLIAQVYSAITRTSSQDLGFDAGTIQSNIYPTLTKYDMSDDNTTSIYAPARWTLEVNLPYDITDDTEVNATTAMSFGNIEDATTIWSVRYDY